MSFLMTFALWKYYNIGTINRLRSAYIDSYEISLTFCVTLCRRLNTKKIF